jgi:ComF family protein
LVYGLPQASLHLQGLLHPWHCLCCGADGEPGRDLCRPCAAELPWLGRACRRCALPLATADRGPDCPRCTAAPPPQAAAIIPFRYAFPVDRLIVGLKFAGRLERARLLGTLLADAVADRLDRVGAASGVLARPAALIATPLHPDRARQRGFNQAAEIARPLAARLGLPLLNGVVARVRATAEQSALDAAARQANVRDAFAVTAGHRAELPDHVAIVDDVVTTGATAAALAAALRGAGVRRVTLWAVARAV